MPVSKLPSSAVAECGVGPAFVQVTVSPASIVMVAGANSKSRIVTDVSAAALARGAGPERRGLESAEAGVAGSSAAGAGALASAAGAAAGAGWAGAPASGAAASGATPAATSGASPG